jgi:hypothetical protein
VYIYDIYSKGIIKNLNLIFIHGALNNGYFHKIESYVDNFPEIWHPDFVSGYHE